jgi:hypothetical protein
VMEEVKQEQELVQTPPHSMEVQTVLGIQKKNKFATQSVIDLSIRLREQQERLVDVCDLTGPYMMQFIVRHIRRHKCKICQNCLVVMDLSRE